MTFRGKSSRLVTPQRTSGLRCNAVAHPVQISLATVDNRNDDELGFIVGMLLGQELLYFTDRGVSRFERQQKLRVLVYLDRKSTRLNSSHVANSYAVFSFK